MLQNYTLIDFGSGRRLDQIDDDVFDRPCPAAEGVHPRDGSRWNAEHRFATGVGWSHRKALPSTLELFAHGFKLGVEAKPFGHLGFFPEQASNWSWLQQIAKRFSGLTPQALNLFAYTGGSTLALAAAGCVVTHVDSSKPSVTTARNNAQRSGLKSAEIRYIVDDARKYVAREIRRRRRYDVIVLDPPAFGHGKGSEQWRLERDLWPLLENCLSLMNEQSALLLSGHSDSVTHLDAAQWLRTHYPDGIRIDADRATITDSFGRHLDAGHRVRTTWNFDDE